MNNDSFVSKFHGIAAMKRTLQILLTCWFVVLATFGYAEQETVTYIQTDHLGSPIMATSQNATVLWREDYQPYGTQMTKTDGDNLVGFTGHLDEKTLGVTYMQGRWYLPEIGRFAAIDPVGFVDENPASFNHYAYGNNNPLRFIDPDGKESQEAMWDLVGGGEQRARLKQARDNLADGLEAGSKVVDEQMTDWTTYLPAGAAAKLGTLGILGAKEIKAVNKLARYNGPKPTYHVNPAHVPGQRGFNPKKTPLPSDAEAVFSKAVPNDPKNPTAWFGKNENGQIYRYSMSNDGTAHFSGINGEGDGVRNLTKYAQDRLNGQ